MIDPSIDACKSRAEMVIQNLRNCNGGHEVHEVGNMRNSATMILSMLEKEAEIDLEKVEGVLVRLENSVVDFFKKKFSDLK